MQRLSFIFLVFSVFSNTALSIPPDPIPTCNIVEVQAFKKFKDKNYRQQGHGWLIARDSEPNTPLRVLTPFHVIAGSDTIALKCLDKTLKAKVVGGSPTLDLALLEIMDPHPENWEPLTVIDEMNTKITFQNKAQALVSAIILKKPLHLQKKSPYHNPVIKTSLEVASGIANPLLGTSVGIQVENFGVRPGFSGVPLLLLENEKSYRHKLSKKTILGMITKTKINDRYSLAIPFQEIVSALPDLYDGIDPWIKTHPNGPYLSYSFRETDSEKIERTKQIILPKSSQNSELIFQEACPDFQYTETSEWILDTGGDWGGGGGNSNISGFSGLFDLDNFILFPDHAFIFKKNHTCKNEGVLLPDGKRLIGIQNKDGTTQRIWSLGDLFPLIVENGSKLLEFLEKQGIFPPLISYAPFCNSIGLNNKTAFVTKSYDSNQSHFFLLNDPEDKEGGFLSSKRFYFLSNALLEKESKEKSRIKEAGTPLDFNSEIRISCSPDQYVILLQYRHSFSLSLLNYSEKNTKESISMPSDPFSNPEIDLNLILSPDFITGTIHIGSCEWSVAQARSHYWSESLENENATILIDLDPHRRVGFIELRLLEVSEHCKKQKDHFPEEIVMPWLFTVQMGIK